MSPSMAATRRHHALRVFEDQDASAPVRTESDIEHDLLNALRPLNDASNRHNIQFPQPREQRSSSPTKTDSSPARPASARQGLIDVKIPPPSHAPVRTGSPQKNAAFYPTHSPPESLAARNPPFGAFVAAAASDKENAFGLATLAPMPPLPYDDGSGYKAPLKRSSMEPAPPKNPPGTKKQKLDRDEPLDLPHPHEMPTVHDDGTKPQHSYAELIGMAILRAPNRRLTLAQIYKWISDNFAFYKDSSSGWQNSIRHNLSLNKNFIKQERPKDDPGKGNYWAIKPGEERPYLLGRKTAMRRITNPDGSQYMAAMPPDLPGFRPASAPAIGQFTLAPNPPKRAESKIDSAKFPDDDDFSSDGTIPASDPGAADDDKDDAAAMPPPPVHFRSSPPPQDIASSPPPMLEEPRRGGTPPPAPRFPSTSRSGGRRQKFAGLNDSGYWSSIESSAARGAAHLLTSEADVGRSRIKKGRAEAEIARIRSSSFDSPSKDSVARKAPAAHLGSSSPLKDDNPLTPAIVFKRPAMPPPSVSPSTNLRNHRDRMRALLGSPAKALSPLPEGSTWSPAFDLAEEGGLGLTPYRSPYATKTPFKALGATPGNTALFNPTTFDIFIDAPEEDTAARGSPEKRSARRPSLARAATSTGILADITGTGKSNHSSLALPTPESPFSLSPFLTKPGSLRSPLQLGSPLKPTPPSAVLHPSPPGHDLSWLDVDVGLGPENAPAAHYPVAVQGDEVDLFGVQLPSDGSEEAIDLFQDFGKIGQQQQPQQASVADRASGSPVKRSAMPPPSPGRPVRPGLGRSSTSRW